MVLTTEGKVEDDIGIDARVEKELARQKAELKKEYMDKAREAGKPICNACFNRDYPDFLKTWKYYTEMKVVKDRPWRSRDTRNPNYGKVTGVHRDYKCTHTFMDKRVSKVCPGKTSIWMSQEELEKEKVPK